MGDQIRVLNLSIADKLRLYFLKDLIPGFIDAAYIPRNARITPKPNASTLRQSAKTRFVYAGPQPPTLPLVVSLHPADAGYGDDVSCPADAGYGNGVSCLANVAYIGLIVNNSCPAGVHASYLIDIACIYTLSNPCFLFFSPPVDRSRGDLTYRSFVHHLEVVVYPYCYRHVNIYLAWSPFTWPHVWRAVGRHWF